MAEADLQLFLAKVRDLNAFVAMAEADPELRAELAACSHHQQVVDLAARMGFAIGRRWGERPGLGSADANLLSGPLPASGEERQETLRAGPGWRLQRIHSCQASSPPGFWYDQSEHEWLCLLQGSARLCFADEEEPRDLNRGDSLWIAPHRRHRLEASDGGSGTVWLVLFWSEAGGAEAAGP